MSEESFYSNRKGDILHAHLKEFRKIKETILDTPMNKQ